MKGFLLVSALLFSSAMPVFTQSQGAAQLIPRRILVSVEFPEDFALSAEIKAKAARSLLVSIAQAEGVRVVEYEGKAHVSRQDWNAEAEKAGADCWLSVSFGGSPDAPTMRLVSYDLALGKQRIQKTVSLASPLSESGISQDLWEETVSSVAEQYFAADPAIIARVAEEKTALTIKALPNTEVSGLPGKPVKVGRDGTAVIEVPIPATYNIRFARQGSWPVFMELYVDSPMTIPVTQEAGPPFAVDFTLYNNFFPGVHAVYFPIPDFLFLKLGIDSFLIGLALSDTAAFFSIPLTDVTFQVGSFFTPEEWVPRVSIAIGAFLRIAHLPENPVIIDGLAPGGGLLAVCAEIGPTPRYRFFLEYSAIIFFTEYPELLQAALGPGDTPPGYVISDSTALSLFNLRLGFRWLP